MKSLHHIQKVIALSSHNHIMIVSLSKKECVHNRDNIHNTLVLQNLHKTLRNTKVH